MKGRKFKPKIKLKGLELELPKTYIKVSCPACDTETPADHINIQDKIAKCGECNAVFPFHEELTSLYLPPQEVAEKPKDALLVLPREVTEKPEDTPLVLPKELIARPVGIDVMRFKNEVEWTIQQPSIDYDFLLWLIPIFAIAPTLLCLLDVSIFIIPTIILWLLSFFPFYNTATRSKQKIYLKIDEHNLDLRWKPRKYQKAQTYMLKDIEQVYVKHLGGMSYSLRLIINGTEGQKHINLISRLRSQSQANYLKQELQRHLDLPDRPVNETS